MSPIPIASRIHEVTVHPRGARVRREAVAPSGATVVRVGDLPLALEDVSVRASCEGGRVIGLHVGLEPDRDEARHTIPVALSEARASATEARVALELARRSRARLERLVALPSPSVGAVSSVETRLALVNLRAHRARKLAARIAGLEQALAEAEGQVRALEARVEGGDPRKFVELRLDAPLAAESRIHVEYGVPGCRWAPAYAVHLDRPLERARLALRAMVRQQSGEDWSGARLVLTTAPSPVGPPWIGPPPAAEGFGEAPVGAVGLYADYDLGFARGAPSRTRPRSGVGRPAESFAESYLCAVEIDDGAGGSEVIDFDQPMINIGRGRHNDIVLGESGVSKEHARIIVRPDGLMVVDLDSSGGTQVNGEPLRAPRGVRTGDQIQIDRFRLTLVEPQDPNAPENAAAYAEEEPEENAFGSDVSADELTSTNLGALMAEPVTARDNPSVPPAPPRITLRFTDEGGSVQVAEFSAWEISLGRARENDLVLNRPDVSKRHARIYVENGRCVIEDLGSSGGTMVNESRIDAPCALGPHDDVFISRFAIVVEPPVMPRLALGPGAAPPPAAPLGPTRHRLVPTRRALDYEGMRLGPPTADTRGQLVAADRRHRYAEALGLPPSETRRLVARAELANRDARDAEKEAAPARHRYVSADAPLVAIVSDGAVEVPSDGHAHAVAVRSAETDVKGCFVAVPDRGPEAFRVAVIDAPLGGRLLSGPLDVYVGGELAASLRLDEAPSDGRVRLGLGVEPAVRVTRALSFDGPTRVEVLTVSNELEVPTAVEVRVRMPALDDKGGTVEPGVFEPETRDLEVEGEPIQGGRCWRVRVPARDRVQLEARYAVKLPEGSELVTEEETR